MMTKSLTIGWTPSWLTCTKSKWPMPVGRAKDMKRLPPLKCSSESAHSRASMLFSADMKRSINSLTPINSQRSIFNISRCPYLKQSLNSLNGWWSWIAASSNYMEWQRGKLFSRKSHSLDLLDQLHYCSWSKRHFLIWAISQLFFVRMLLGWSSLLEIASVLNLVWEELKVLTVPWSPVSFLTLVALKEHLTCMLDICMEFQFQAHKLTPSSCLSKKLKISNFQES